MNKVEQTPSRKLVKVGKEEHLIDAAVLDAALEQFGDAEEIVLHTFLDKLPEGAEDLYDALVFGLPVEKKESQYAELCAVLNGRVAVGKGVFRNNEFQVIVTVGTDGLLRLRKLVDPSQKYGVEFVMPSVQMNAQIVALENKIIDKKMVSAFDVSQFRDSRGVVEEQIITELVLHGKVECVKPVLRESQEQDELARLKALSEN
jgi:hypothetical protein